LLAKKNTVESPGAT